MIEWEIWIEGYATTGERQTAKLIGRQVAETFDEACIKYIGTALDRNADGDYERGPVMEDPGPGLARYAKVNCGGNYRIWGAQLFDNELSARKSFG